MDKMCHPNACFGGIVYLHDINQSRNQSRIETLTLVKLTCPEPANHVLMTTVKWGRIQQHSRDEHREQELKTSVWKKILDRGARICRFINTQDSAWEVVDTVLQGGTLELHIVQRDLARILRLFHPKLASNKPRRGFFDRN
ncbi:hypothetical protein B0H34DRAFT_739004 [Crassisporium funariophilum]|nr:hypothetical protein B0H34DRAFT_739004 [Crassisporium funariophilum]